MASWNETETINAGYRVPAPLICTLLTGCPVKRGYISPEISLSFECGYHVHRDLLGSMNICNSTEYVGGKSITGEVADINLASVALRHKFGFSEDRKTRYKKRGEETYFDAHYYKLNLE